MKASRTRTALTLYNAAYSTCSQKVRICLAEKQLRFQEHRLNLAKKEHLDPEYLKLNPHGVVPTLVDGKALITDSSVICEYLDERYPDNPLSPADLVAKARMRAWMRYLEEVPTAAVRVPSFNMAFLPRFEGLTPAQFHAEQSDVRPLRKHFYRRMGPAGFGPSEIEASLEQLEGTWRKMEQSLEVGPWLLGEQYSLADIVAAPLVDRMVDLGIARPWLQQYTKVADWHGRLLQREAFQTAFYPGSRLSEFLPVRPTM